MRFKFKDEIFNEYFTAYDTRSDLNVTDGKGTNQRWQECIGEDLDDNVVPYIDNFRPNVLEPKTVLLNLLPYIESRLGYKRNLWPWFFNMPEAMRRSVANIMRTLYTVRSTKRAYNIMFKWLGMTAVIVEEVVDEGGWDNDTRTFDEDDWTFDNGCPTCSSYSIALTGPYPSLTPDLIEAIQTIITYNNPINAIVDSVTYNGETAGGDFNNDFNDDFNI